MHLKPILETMKLNLRPYKDLLKLGMPLVIGQLGMIIIGFADTLMIGHHKTLELAAASFVNSMVNLTIIFGTGFAYGLTPIVGSLFGQGKKADAGRMLKNSLTANLLIALILCVILGIIYLNLGNLGQPQELLPYMRPYFLILLCAMPFVLLFNGFRQFTDGITDTKVSMFMLLGGNIVHIFSNYILIYGKWGFPELGLTGAGVSTLLVRILMVVAYILLLTRSKRYAIYKKGFFKGKINRKDFLHLSKVGIPVACQMGMETASFGLSVIMVGWLGSVALAAHQVMLAISQLCFMMLYGMGSATAVRISYFYGQGDIENVRRTANTGFHLILMMIVCTILPILLLRNLLGGWFTDNGQVSLIVSQLVLMLALYQFGDGLQIAFANALRGITDVKLIMLFSFIAYFVISLPSGYLFGFVFNWGIEGIWAAFPFGLTSAGLMFYLRFRYKTRLLKISQSSNS